MQLVLVQPHLAALEPHVSAPVIVTVKETQYVNLGLRTELGLWCVRTLGRFPLVYRLGRAVYRAVIKRE